MTNLSPHFTLEEATLSQTAVREGLNNSPQHPETIAIMQYTAQRMESVREFLNNRPILVSSWYRSPEVNFAIRGSKDSQHMTGNAVDFICPGYGTPYVICDAIMKADNHLQFDQLIYEGTWVHISFAIPGSVPRKQVLTFMKDRSYKLGLYESR